MPRSTCGGRRTTTKTFPGPFEFAIKIDCAVEGKWDGKVGKDTEIKRSSSTRSLFYRGYDEKSLKWFLILFAEKHEFWPPF